MTTEDRLRARLRASVDPVEIPDARDRIAERLTEPPGRQPAPRWRVPVVLAAIAACAGAASIVITRSGNDTSPTPGATVLTPTSSAPPPTQTASSSPTPPPGPTATTVTTGTSDVATGPCDPKLAQDALVASGSLIPGFFDTGDAAVTDMRCASGYALATIGTRPGSSAQGGQAYLHWVGNAWQLVNLGAVQDTDVPPGIAAQLRSAPLIRSTGIPLSAVDWTSVTYPVNCGPGGHAIATPVTYTQPDPAAAVAVVLVSCEAGAGSPPTAILTYDHANVVTAPHVAQVLLSFEDNWLTNADSVTADGTSLAISVYGYSSEELPRCCPDLHPTLTWIWSDGQYAASATQPPHVNFHLTTDGDGAIPDPGAEPRRVLAPATVPPVGDECALALTDEADGNVTPLLCPSGGVNTLAWAHYATGTTPLGCETSRNCATHESAVMSVGRDPTVATVHEAMCSDFQLMYGTSRLTISAARLAGAYFGWPPTVTEDPQIINFVSEGCSPR